LNTNVLKFIYLTKKQLSMYSPALPYNNPENLRPYLRGVLEVDFVIAGSRVANQQGIFY
jgi:hypothetical protein